MRKYRYREERGGWKTVKAHPETMTEMMMASLKRQLDAGIRFRDAHFVYQPA